MMDLDLLKQYCPTDIATERFVRDWSDEMAWHTAWVTQRRQKPT